MILTVEQMIIDLERMAREACEEAGVDYQEFLQKLDTVLGEQE